MSRSGKARRGKRSAETGDSEGQGLEVTVCLEKREMLPLHGRPSNQRGWRGMWAPCIRILIFILRRLIHGLYLTGCEE